MTECNQDSFEFEELFSRQVVARFDGGTISSDAGGLLLRETDRRIRLLKRLRDCFRYGQMRDVLLADYAANRRKWLRQRKDGGFYVCNLPELDKFFEGYRVIAITTDAIRAFIQKRQADGAANGTTNRSLALLRRMFHLALQDGQLRD